MDDLSYDLDFKLDKHAKTYNHVPLTDVSVSRPTYKGYTGSIFTLIVTILLILALFKVLSSQEPFTFQSLLQSLSSLPRVNLQFTPLINLSIGDSWGIFDFLRGIISASVTVVNVLVWFFSLIGQGINWLYNLIILIL